MRRTEGCDEFRSLPADRVPDSGSGRPVVGGLQPSADAIHAAVLPTGKVLLFSAEYGVPGIHGYVFDPTSIPGTPVLTNVPPPSPWNPNCAGHSFLPDGRLLVAGGTLGLNPTRGPKTAYIFDPYNEQWVQIAHMRAGRWYPTSITLPDGRIIAMSGLSDTTGAINPDIELWDPNGTDNLEPLGQKPVSVRVPRQWRSQECDRVRFDRSGCGRH